MRWPDSLHGRLALLLFGALAGAHLLTLGWIVREREQLAGAMMTAYAGRDLGAGLAILDRVPAAERPRWLPRLARAHYAYRLDAEPAMLPAADSAFARALMQSVVAEIGAQRVLALQQDGARHLVLTLRLDDGGAVGIRLQAPGTPVSRATLAVLALQGLMLALAAWWVVRLATRPLRQLADAAQVFDPERPNAPLPLQGPREVRQAATAFNAMQARLDRHAAERARMLADIAHDLRLPITRMRVRTDLLDDSALREKLQADLLEMQGLVEAGIAYARSAQPDAEAARAVDLHALLDGLVCDYADAGRPVQLEGRAAKPVITRPQALQRVMANLIDNALKFGREAQVVVRSDLQEVRIAVRDRGPGIPEPQLPLVLQPFYRLEPSRNRDTGGAGLGLAIAHRLAVQALRGALVLRNRAEGGLEAELRIPAAS